jgi:putative isomerase
MNDRTLPAARAWNTWDPVYPAELVHLPSGRHVALMAYSDAAGAFTRFPPGPSKGVTLGPRSVDAGSIELGLEHAGTRLKLRVTQDGDEVLKLAWRTEAFGEWGLRFWVLVCLWRDDEAGGAEDWSYDPETTDMFTCTGNGDVVVKGPRFPLMATFHDSLEALQAEYEDKGYFYLASRGTGGPVGVLRYNLEEMADFEVAFTWAPSRKEASARLDAALARPAEAPLPAAQEGRFAGALDAVRDAVAWNTVWDPANRRPYTSLSRNWVAQKFGGWGVWLNDVFYHGLMGGLVDPDLAHENQKAVFDGVTEAGNLPCLLTGNDSWIDRSQPPIGGFITWCHYLRSGDRRFLEEAWPALLSNHDWWWRTRDGNANGLLEFGTSPVGDGLYRGTKLAAKDESMMDNSPIHDEARLVPETHTLDCEDVALNSLIALDAEMLARIAGELGELDQARRLSGLADAQKARIRDGLWDEERGIFANRLWSGKFVDSLAPTSFFPLICGASSSEQARSMIENYFRNPEKFGGHCLLPAVCRDDPAFRDNVYWRGRIWPPLNFLTYTGLRRYRFDVEARALATSGYRLFMSNWEGGRLCGENFNGTTGRADDQPDTDLFYTWGALMAYIAVAEITDVTPWDGWSLANPTEEACRLGPIRSPAGATRLEISQGWLTLLTEHGPTLRSNVTGRLRHLKVTDEEIAVEVPAGGGARRIEVLGDGGRRALGARLGGREIQLAGDGRTVPLPASDAPARLTVTLGRP